MNSLHENIKRTFWLFGERSALIAVVVVYLLVLSFQGSKSVYSKEEEQFLRQTPTYEASSEVNANPPLSDSPAPIAVTLGTEEITPTPTPLVTPTPVQPQSSDNGDVWERIAMCESRGNWGIDTGNGYFGGLQFSQGAWNSVGGEGKPSDASKDEQIKRGKMLQEKRGWGVWGDCAKRLGL